MKHCCVPSYGVQVDPLDRSGHPEDRRARRVAVAHQLQQDYAAAEALVEALKDVSVCEGVARGQTKA